MLKKSSFFALCTISIFFTVSGSGEFCILSSPDALTFTDSGKLDGEIVDDILYASAGNTVEGSKEWNGLKINNPFDDSNIFAFAVEGLDQIAVTEKERCYPMLGGYSANPGFQSSDLSVVDLDLNQIDGAFEEYTSLSRESLERMPLTMTNKHLKPELHSEDKQFLKMIEYIRVLASTYASSKKQPDIMIVRLSLDPVIKTHGANSPALAEAAEKIADAVENLRDSILNVSATRPLIVTIASKGGRIRTKRATESEKKGNDNPLNLAEYYNEDFPVIFNIILWFMVVFGFSLLAICYAIGSMDPGRDSIIYRMTSTRMKKDN